MKYTPFAIALVILALCLLPAPGQDEPFVLKPEHGRISRSGEPTEEQERFANGTHVTRRLLHELKFTALPTTQEYDDNPADTLLIVLGKLSTLSELDKPGRGRLQRFLNDGGAILIASNLEASVQEAEILRRLCRVYVLPKRTVIETTDKREAYKEHLDCPFVEPGSDGVADQLFLSEKGQLKLVATNRPSALWRIWDDQGRRRWPLPLAFYPPNSSPDILTDRDGSQWKPLFAVGGESKDGGKLLLLADHGVFINMMMMPRDNDNLSFALNTFTWLREGPKGQQRRQALFFEEDGSVNGEFEVPLRRLPNLELPEIKPEDLPILVGQADRILSGMESDNVFDSYLERSHGWRQGPELWGPVAVVSSLILLIWGGWRLIGPGLVGPIAFGSGLMLLSWASWRLLAGPWSVMAFVSGLILFSWGTWRLIVWRWTSIEPGLPTLNLALAGHTPQVSTLTERQRALLRSGNLWESAHALARETFARLGLTVAADRAPMPRFVARGGFWARWALLARIRRLWLLGFGPPRRVSAAAWTRLAVEVEDLTALLESGEVQVEGHTPPSRRQPV